MKNKPKEKEEKPEKSIPIKKEETKEEKRELLPRALESDPLGTHGILLSDEIEFFVDENDLIDPFEPENLKPAGYYIRVGDEFTFKGETTELEDKPGKNEIKIPPFEVAIIKTYEWLNLPRFLVARWNITVDNAYKGLLWLGGPQVDPGWSGHLNCPIYNLSNIEVELRLKDRLAVMDFIKTTPFNENSKPYPPLDHSKRTRYQTAKLNSGLFEFKKAFDKMSNDVDGIDEKIDGKVKSFYEEIESDIKSYSKKIDTFILATFTVVAILLAALSMMTTSDNFNLPSWVYLSFGLSVGALIIAIGAYMFVSRDIADIIAKAKCKLKECKFKDFNDTCKFPQKILNMVLETLVIILIIFLIIIAFVIIGGNTLF